LLANSILRIPGCYQNNYLFTAAILGICVGPRIEGYS